ncbi:MAG: sugar transferase [Bacteroidota bacterium]
MSFRIRDVLLSSLGLLVLAPIGLLIALGLWLSQGKVFFFQARAGLHEKVFTLIKFSTMRDAAPGEDEAARQRERITPFGAVLRRYSLDELPQLLHVLRGEMSLVGPRPLLVDYLALYTTEEKKRHQVKPGITGWAQIHGRNALSFKQRFAYDLWYVEHRSFWLDAKILCRTVAKVFRSEGVYADELSTSPRYDGKN